MALNDEVICKGIIEFIADEDEESLTEMEKYEEEEQ